MAKILIVEDNTDYQELLQNFLESAGYEITAAKDGMEALEYAAVTPFDLILLDLMLPKMFFPPIHSVIPPRVLTQRRSLFMK